MITSEQLIQEYCSKLHLKYKSAAGCDRFVLQDQLLYLTTSNSETFERMAKIDLKYCAKVLRVVKIVLKVDVSMDNVLIPTGSSMSVIHFEKCNEITSHKVKYLNDYLTFIHETFKEKLGTTLIQKNNMPKILGKVKTSNNKIFWQELTSQLVPIINELATFNIDITITIDKLALRNNQYVWNWIETKKGV